MNDIRTLIADHPDAIRTRDGHKVEVVTTTAGCNHNLIFGYVHKGGRKLGHYWQANGTFSHKHDSPVTLVVDDK